MYALIDNHSMLIGFFSSKKRMKMVIEALIKNHYEVDGYHGNYHFRYVKMNLDEPWLTKDGEPAPAESNAILSLATMHPKKFIHEVKTDWNTGEILKL